MLTKIVLKNILGINNEIELDFMSVPKKKEKKDTIKLIEKNVNINKVIGIIGANASGKSSIINALNDLFWFLSQDRILQIAKEKKDDDFIKKISGKIMPKRNKENLESDSLIALEMYINDNEVKGFYNYKLSFNNEYLEEQLTYKKTYNSKKIEIIENYKSVNFKSNIGYKCFHKDTIIKDYEEVDCKLANNFKKKLKYNETFYNYFSSIWNNSFDQSDLNILEIELLKNTILNYNRIIEGLLKIVDSKIEEVSIEKNSEEEEEIRFKIGKNKHLLLHELSTGTKRILTIVCATLRVINDNGIMICDEIETALHRELVKLVIDLFIKNDKYCQLIFTTHIPEILDNDKMRNDQKFFITKENKMNITKISDINPRSDYSISKNYYSEKVFKPQPNDEDIEKFCIKVNELFNENSME